MQGKAEPILVYELLGLKDNTVSLDKYKLYDSFIKGYEAYIKRNFEEAKQHFQESLEKIPDDKLSKIYLERCEEFILNPPPSDWDGISRLETK